MGGTGARRWRPPGSDRLLAVGIVVGLFAGGVAVVGPSGATGAPAAPVGPPVAGSAAPAVWSCHGVRLLGTPACAGEAVATGAKPAGPLSTPGWVLANASPPAFSLYDFEMAYDAADGYVVVLGSVASTYGSLGPTRMWSYAGRLWAPLAPAVMPENCPGSTLAYDSTDGYVVYFGGPPPYSGTCASAGQTWTYVHGAWTQQFPATSPPELYGASLSDDPADGYLVLFGGSNNSCGTQYPIGGYCNETWTYSAGAWTRLTPALAPSHRAEAGMAYDAADGYLVLFGGTNVSGPQNDTWSFAGGTWTRLRPAVSPPAPTPDAFSYDSTDGRIVYTSAENYSGPTPEITWTYAGGNWSPVTSSAPPQRLGAGSADDPADQGLLFFGGTGWTPLDDSWLFRAGNWTNVTVPTPAQRIGAAAAYDSATGAFILFSGSNFTQVSGANLPNDTWAYTSTGWTELTPGRSPPPRGGGQLADDVADGYLLLFGGTGAGGPLNDTWEYAAGTWTALTPTAAPPSIYGTSVSVVYDGADGYVLALVGAPGHMWTWTYRAGVWTNITSTAGSPPPGPAANPLVYDSTDGYVLLFGTVQPALTDQTWTFAGGRWTNRTAAVGPAPPAAAGGSLVDFPPGGYVLLYQGTGANDTWTYANGTWTPVFAPYGPPAVAGMASAYDPALSGAVFFGGDSTVCGALVYGCESTWLWNGAGAVGPYVRSFALLPSTTDVGRPVNATIDVVGGVVPLSFAYAGLPGGCGSANRSTLSCTPTTVGTYLVRATVTDAAGHTASASAELTVHAALAVPSLAVTASTVPLGGTVDFTTSVAGGTSPYDYAYAGLPPGCASQTVPVLPCTPSAAGRYAVSATVGDAVGGSATASTALTVQPAGSAGGPFVYGFAASPPAIVLGNATNLTVNASGGTAPYSYAYAGLPAGCASANQTPLACRPIASGTFAVGVTVTDARGNATSVTTNLTVYPVGGGAGLFVTAFGASPSTFTVGNGTVLTVVANGGVGPLGYAYAGLPPGCAPANASVLACVPTAAGVYTLSVTTFDSAGDRAGVLATLTVLPSAAGPAPAIARFLISPTTVTEGTPFTVVVSVAGGTLPLHYAYAGLPPGCRGPDADVLTCTPTQAGNFSVNVTVTDALGRTANASGPLRVVPFEVPPSTSVPPNLFATPVALATLFGLGVGISILVALSIDRERRRRDGRRLVRELADDGPPPGPDDRGV
jgi:Galactose oxidase, central domain/MBG domain